jgi:integrase
MSIHRTRTSKWGVRYREGRRNRSKTFDLKQDARSFEAETRVRRQRGEHVRRSSETPTLRDFAADWMDRRLAAGLSEATLKTNGLIFDKHLDPYLGGLRVGDLSPRRLDEWRRELEAAGASAYMLNRSKTLLGQILADARRLDFVAINVARGLPTVRRRARRGKTATPEQVEAMRASFLESGHLGHATLISLLAYVGLRPREALDLRWEMLDRDRLLLPAELTKGQTARSPDVPRPVIADLGRWRLASGALGGLVFPRPADGSRWTKASWDNWRKRGFTKAAGAAGLLDWAPDAETWVGNFRPYDLRHTCASDDPRPRRPSRCRGAARHQPRAHLPDLRAQHRGDARAAFDLDRGGDLRRSIRRGLRRVGWLRSAAAFRPCQSRLTRCSEHVRNSFGAPALGSRLTPYRPRSTRPVR